MPRERSSYYYPQGLHIGHIFFIIRQIGNRNFSEPLRSVDYYDEPLSENFRQTRYKIWFMMELGLIKDDRIEGDSRCYKELTPLGMQWFAHLKKLESESSFPSDFYDFVGRWRMKHNAGYYIDFVNKLENIAPQFFKLIRYTLLKTDSIHHFIKFFIHEKKTNNVDNHTIYAEYFQTGYVRDFFDEKGLRQASRTSAEHRLPILIALLESIGIMKGYLTPQNEILKLPLFLELFGEDDEIEGTKRQRRNLVISYYSQRIEDPNYSMSSSDNVDKLRDLFGSDFLTPNYPIIQILSLDTMEEIGTLEEVELPDITQLEKEEDLEEEEQRQSLSGLSEDEINDIVEGLDTNVGGGRKNKTVSTNRKQGNAKIKAVVKKRDNYTCQICEEPTFFTPTNIEYVEVHHILPNGDDLPYNMISVCPTCHEKFTHGSNDVKIEVYAKLKEIGILEKIEEKIGTNPLIVLKEENEISEVVFNALQ